MYFALKPVKFDKDYSRGEEIPKEVIAPNMVEKLIRCGVIQEAEGAGEPETGKQLEEETNAEEPPRENEVENEPPKEKTKAVKQPKKV